MPSEPKPAGHAPHSRSTPPTSSASSARGTAAAVPDDYVAGDVDNRIGGHALNVVNVDKKHCPQATSSVSRPNNPGLRRPAASPASPFGNASRVGAKKPSGTQTRSGPQEHFSTEKDQGDLTASLRAFDALSGDDEDHGDKGTSGDQIRSGDDNQIGDRGSSGSREATSVPKTHASLTNLTAPAPGARPVVQTGPSGPSERAVEIIREAAKKKLGDLAVEEGVDPGRGSVASRQSVSPQARQGTTASQATLDQYHRRGQSLFDRYRRERKLVISAEELSPVEFVNWLLSLKPRLKSSTWRMYRQSAVHFVEGFPSDETDEAIRILNTDIIDYSRPESTPIVRDGKKRRLTSAQKEKSFRLEDMNKILAYLETFSRSKNHRILSDWLRAGVLTGLRPIEWRTTDLEIRDDKTAPYGRRVWLYVLNAKATNDRGTGVVRTLDLSSFDDSDLACVERMVDRGRTWLLEHRFAEMKDGAQNLLYHVTRRLWPRRRRAYALYSCRHQAIANWKAVLPAVEIAALSGHGITSTATSHYGKKRSAWNPDDIPPTPRPVPEELRHVRDRIRLFEDRIKLEQAAGLRSENDNPEYPVG